LLKSKKLLTKSAIGFATAPNRNRLRLTQSAIAPCSGVEAMSVFTLVICKLFFYCGGSVNLITYS